MLLAISISSVSVKRTFKEATEQHISVNSADYDVKFDYYYYFLFILAELNCWDLLFFNFVTDFPHLLTSFELFAVLFSKINIFDCLRMR